MSVALALLERCFSGCERWGSVVVNMSVSRSAHAYYVSIDLIQRRFVTSYITFNRRPGNVCKATVVIIIIIIIIINSLFKEGNMYR